MQKTLAAGNVQSDSRIVSTSRHIYFALVAIVAFSLYWFSANVLQSRDQMHLFGADTAVYLLLADENVIDRIGTYPFWLDRITRFHPVTTALAVTWMEILSPLTPWVTRQQLLKALFAAVGAVGAWAAMWAFAALVANRYAILLGVIYATSLGIWYFASVEESKIVSATLTALYIAAYLHLRKRWTMRGAVLLTAILLLACLNEIIAGFLIVIPMVDTLMQRGWDLRHSRWIACHGLAAPIAFVFLEGVVNGYVVAAETDREGASHLVMLVFYMQNNYLNAEAAYTFLVNWLFFSIAAPTLAADYMYRVPGDQYFEPVLTNYFSSPLSISLAALLGVMLAASVLGRYRAENAGHLTGILLAVGAYSLLRGTFILFVYARETLLFSTPVTLAHMLVLGIPFAASKFPAKFGLLVAFALLLFIVNGTFIVGV